MAQPPIYQRSKDFTVDYSNESDHSAINNELDGAATSINAIRTNLALIQKDDGGLKNGIVTADSIAASLITTLSAQINALLEVQFSELSLGTYFKETFIDGVDYTAGSTTQITLDGTPSSKANTTVHFDGVLQHQTEYELAANVITFDAAIPSGVVQVEVGFANTLSEGLIGDGSVNTIHLNDAVFNGLTQVTAAADDYVVLADTSNGGGKRKALVSSVLTQMPAGGITNAMLADSFANDLTTVTANLLDAVVIADASDSGKKKKALVSGIFDLQPAGSIAGSHLSDSVVSDLTSVSAALGDSVMLADVSDSNKKKRALISSILSLMQAASTSVAGIAQLATAAQATNYTGSPSATAVCTPASLVGARAYAFSGYQQLPGGLLVQWGRTGDYGNVSSGANAGTVAFPLAFPNAVMGVVMSCAVSAAPSGAMTVAWDIGSTTNSTLAFDFEEFVTRTQTNTYFTYIAIGY